jgi:RNA recognition motif-containing protein
MNIYIGNLHYNVNEEELKGIFKEYGEVMSLIKRIPQGSASGYGGKL